MASRYQTLLADRAKLVEEGQSLSDKAELSDQERERLTALTGELKATNEEIKALEALREQMRQAPSAQTIHDPEKPGSGAGDTPPPKAESLPTPFRNLGEQLQAVRKAALQPHAVDPRLTEIQAAVQGASEGTQSDGGFAVQVDFSTELIRLIHESGVLVGKTDRTTIGPNSNGLKVNAIDETSRVNGSRAGGVLAYWTAEGAALTATKPKLRQMELSLQKLTGLYYATDELLMDAAALAQEATKDFIAEFGFKLDDAIVRGTGAGMPLGILGHAATVSVAKETGQAAATIVKQNVEKMYARMWARSVPRAEWYINQDCWPALFELSVAVGVGGVPLFIPSNSLANAPFGTLLGRPIRPIEHCESLGTVGDIIFADLAEYKMIEKGGIDAASSIHVEFLTDQTVFRWILRADGQPKRNAPLTPYKGSNTQSSFITLATRA